MEDLATFASSLKLASCTCKSRCEARTTLDDLPLCHALIRLVAAGQPLPLGDLVQITGLPLDDLIERLARMDLAYDEEGRVIGDGLTLRPTPHRFEIGVWQLVHLVCFGRAHVSRPAG